MQNILARNEEGADALRINQLIQAETRQAYWISGGAAAPGSSSTSITVSIDAGEASISDSTVTWTNDTVQLSATSTSYPRVDTISIQSDGTFSVTQGEERQFDPQPGGNAPEPFEHWDPHPDDGRGVSGVPLCCVLIEPSMSNAGDLTNNHVQDRRLPAASQSAYVRGDGENNGNVTVTTDDADFAVQDTTDTTSKYLFRDHSANALKIGSPTAKPEFRTNVDLSGNKVENAGRINVSDNAGAVFDISADTGTTKVLWSGGGSYRGVSGHGNDIPFLVDAGAGNSLFSVIGTGGINLHDSVVKNVNNIEISSSSGEVIDLRPNSDGSQVLWRHDDGASAATEYFAASWPGSTGEVFTLQDKTNSTNLFRVNTDGQAFVEDGDRVATRPWANGKFITSSGGVFTGKVTVPNTFTLNGGAGDPPAPSNSGEAHLYYDTGSGTIEAKRTDGTVTTLGTF